MIPDDPGPDGEPWHRSTAYSDDQIPTQGFAYGALALAVLIGLLHVAVVVLALVWMVTWAGAHDAPTGWAYPVSCCSGFDCREESDLAVRETDGGYLIVSTGELIPYTDKRVRMSPDGRWHGCWRGAKFDAAPLICLFAPPRAF